MDYSTIKNWDDACIAAACLPHGTEQNTTGTGAETFLAGWVNAADMIDDHELNPTDDESILRFVFAEFDNMGHKR